MTLEELAQERYVSLTTFKGDGTAVATPVWVVGDHDRLLVWTAADSWKVKRIRRDSHVVLAPCTARGRVRGEAISGDATILSDTSLVERLEREKYGLAYRVIGSITAALRRGSRRLPSESVTVSITEPERELTAH